MQASEQDCINGGGQWQEVPQCIVDDAPDDSYLTQGECEDAGGTWGLVGGSNTWSVGSCDSSESGRSENQANCEQAAGTFVTIYAAENPTACAADKLTCISRPRQCDLTSSAYVDKYSFYSQNLITNDDSEENIDLYSHSGSTGASKIIGNCPTDISVVKGREGNRPDVTCINSDGSACVNTCPIDNGNCPAAVKETPSAAVLDGDGNVVQAAVGDNVYSVSNAGAKLVEDVNTGSGSCQRFINYNDKLCASSTGADMTLTLSMPNGAKYCDGTTAAEFTACKRERKLLEDFVWKLPCNELSEQMRTLSGASSDAAGYEDYLNFEVPFSATPVADISTTFNIGTFNCGSDTTTGVCKQITGLCEGFPADVTWANLGETNKALYISRLRALEVGLADPAGDGSQAAEKTAYALYGVAGLGSLQCSALLAEINEDLAGTLFDGTETDGQFTGGCRGLQNSIVSQRNAFAATVGHLHQLAKKRQRMENYRLLMVDMKSKITSGCEAHFNDNQRTAYTYETADDVKSLASDTDGPGLKRAFEMAATTQQDNVISIERKRVENVLTNIDDQLNYLKTIQDTASSLIASETVASTKSVSALKLILTKIGNEFATACPDISAEILGLVTTGVFTEPGSTTFKEYIDSNGYYVNPLYAILSPEAASAAGAAADKVRGIRNRLEDLVDASVEYCYRENGKIFDDCEECATRKISARDDELETIVEPLLAIKSGIETAKATALADSCAAAGASSAARIAVCSADDKVINALSFSTSSTYLTNQQIVGYEGEGSLDNLINDLGKCTEAITVQDTRTCPDASDPTAINAFTSTQNGELGTAVGTYNANKAQCIQALDRLIEESASVDSTSGELAIFVGQCTGEDGGEPDCGPHTAVSCAGCADITPVVGPSGSSNNRCGPGIYQKVLAYAQAERAAYTATQAYNAELAKGGMSVKAVKDKQDDVSKAEEFVEIIHKHIHALKDEKTAYEGRADLLFQKCETLVDKKVDAIVKHAIKTEVLNREWEVTSAFKANLNDYVDGEVRNAASDYCNTVQSVQAAASSLSIKTADYVTGLTRVDCDVNPSYQQCQDAQTIIGSYTVGNGDSSDTIYNNNFAGDKFADNSDGHCLPVATGGGDTGGGDGGGGDGGGGDGGGDDYAGPTAALCSAGYLRYNPDGTTYQAGCTKSADNHPLLEITGASCASDP